MTQHDWVKVTAIVHIDSYPLCELARASALRTKGSLPDCEATSWGIVLSLLAGDYLAGSMPGFENIAIAPDPFETIDTNLLYEIMGQARGLTPEKFQANPEKGWQKLEQFCQQIGISPLDFQERVTNPFLEWYKNNHPEQTRLRNLEDENERLRQELERFKAIQAGLRA